MKVLLVGAGLSGAVIGRRLAEAGHEIEIVDGRDHVGGNCHTERDPDTGVLVHRYGPHIFHTDDAEVWDYVNSFETFLPYKNRVKTTSQGAVYSLPINLHTINQFYGAHPAPRRGARLHRRTGRHLHHRSADLRGTGPALRRPDLYEAFFKGYTDQAMGLQPSELPASILKRLPVRFNYDDNYFFHRFQGMPENGYTAMVTRDPRSSAHRGASGDLVRSGRHGRRAGTMSSIPGLSTGGSITSWAGWATAPWISNASPRRGDWQGTR